MDKQGLFAAIDIQDSSDKKDDKTESNRSRMGTLNSVVADAVRFAAEIREQTDQAIKEIKELLPPHGLPTK